MKPFLFIFFVLLIWYIIGTLYRELRELFGGRPRPTATVLFIGGLTAILGAVPLHAAVNSGFGEWVAVATLVSGVVLVVLGAVFLNKRVLLRNDSQLLTIVNNLIGNHIAELAAARARKVYVKYGVEETDAWRREVDHFFDSVVVPQLSTLPPRLLQRESQAAANLVAKQYGRSAGPNVGPGDALRRIVFEMIEDRVRRYDQAPSACPAAVRPDTMSPRQFESFCVKELQAAGWDARACGASGDQGVDIVAYKGGRGLVLQCKLHSHAVGNSAVQEIYAGLRFHRDAQCAAVVTNADFTKSARAAARRTGVLLLHWKNLRSLSIQNGRIRY